MLLSLIILIVFPFYAIAGKHHDLCLVGHILNEPFLLPQWITYHRFLGVSKFFIADDCSSDPAVSLLLQLYNHLGHVEDFGPDNSTELHVVDLCDTPNRRPKQHQILGALVKYSSRYCRFIIVIDSDEYIAHDMITTPKQKELAQFLLNSSNENSSFFGLRMPWMLMDSHLQIKRPKGLLIENSFNGFVYEQMNMVVKTEFIDYWYNAHFPIFNKTKGDFTDYQTVLIRSQDMINIDGCMRPKTHWYIRHYYLRSWEEYTHFRAARKFLPRGVQNPYSNNFTIWQGLSHFSSPCNNISREFIDHIIPKVKGMFLNDAEILAHQSKRGNIKVNSLLLRLNINIDVSIQTLIQEIYGYFYDPPINWNLFNN